MSARYHFWLGLGVAFMACACALAVFGASEVRTACAFVIGFVCWAASDILKALGK